MCHAIAHHFTFSYIYPLAARDWDLHPFLFGSPARCVVIYIHRQIVKMCLRPGSWNMIRTFAHLGRILIWYSHNIRIWLIPVCLQVDVALTFRSNVNTSWTSRLYQHFTVMMRKSWVWGECQVWRDLHPCWVYTLMVLFLWYVMQVQLRAFSFVLHCVSSRQSASSTWAWHRCVTDQPFQMSLTFCYK